MELGVLAPPGHKRQSPWFSVMWHPKHTSTSYEFQNAQRQKWHRFLVNIVMGQLNIYDVYKYNDENIFGGLFDVLESVFETFWTAQNVQRTLIYIYIFFSQYKLKSATVFPAWKHESFSVSLRHIKPAHAHWFGSPRRLHGSPLFWGL